MSIKAVLLGRGPLDSSLRALVGRLDLERDVRFVGSVDNVLAFLEHVDIGVLCSDAEGLSNAIMEYMVCGLPVVATTVGGNPELVDASNGFCVAPGDPAALAKALGILIRDPDLRRKLGKRSREKIDSSFSWSRSQKELESYYLQLLEARFRLRPRSSKLLGHEHREL